MSDSVREEQAAEDWYNALQREVVVLESPWQNGLESNVVYLRRCLADSLSRMEAPVASHRMYTDVWDDANPEEREAGMTAGWTFMNTTNRSVVYTDYGITPGMERAINIAKYTGMRIDYRTIGENPE